MKNQLVLEKPNKLKEQADRIELIELTAKEKSSIITVARNIAVHEKELIQNWIDMYFQHLQTQRKIPLKDAMSDPENISLKSYMMMLVNDFIQYIGNGDFEGYIKANAQLGAFMAKENLSFEKIILGFHFFENSYNPLLAQQVLDSRKFLEIIQSLDGLHHNTLATIAREYFKVKNLKIHILQDSRDKMISGLVHDVKNKLAFGKALPEMFRDGIFKRHPEKLPYYMDILEKNMKDAFELITDGLDYGRIIDGTYHPRIQSTDLVDIVRKIVEPFIPTFDKENKNIFINGILYTGGPIKESIFADVDSKQISRVFGNLFSNAAKYTKDEIRFIIEDRNHEIYCSVQDNGIGIEKDYQQRIFERGTQIPGNQKEVSSGIGLDTVKKIVELHRGRVGVVSKPGKGSNFFFDLPKKK